MAYDIQTTTDDRGMHITGICTDQNNSKYFIVKILGEMLIIVKDTCMHLFHILDLKQ